MKKMLGLSVVLAVAPFAQAADIEAGKARAATVCAACHGANGVSVSDTIPNLAAQRAGYLESQLKAFKEVQRGEVKPHDEFFAGQVTQLYPQEDHGFLLTHEGTQLYFHRNGLVNRDFDRLKVGDKVHFVETVGDTGPIASKVWPTEGEPG